MVYLFNNQVSLAPTPQLDAFGRLRVSQPQTLFDSQQRFGLDRSFVSNTLSGGQISFVSTQSSANLQITNTNGSYAARESRYVFKYQPGKSQLSLTTFVMAPQSSGNIQQRVGYFGSDNGYYFELSDYMYFVQRSNVYGVSSNTAVVQSSWNGDTLNGSGASGINLDITKSQILFFDMEWLGAGSVRCGFVINGQFIVAHTFQHANIVPTAYMTTACLPIRYEIRNVSGSGPATSNLIQICSTVASEAGYNEPLSLFSNSAAIPTSFPTPWAPVVSARLQPGRLDAISLIEKVDIVLTSSGTLQWAIWSSSNVYSGTSFTTPPQNGSIQIDKSSTSMNVASSWQVASGIITNGVGLSSASSISSLSSYFAQIGRDSFSQTSDIMTLAVTSLSGTPSGFALLSWQELL